MRKKIFTLLLLFCAGFGLLKAQEEVPVINLTTADFILEALNGGTAEITKAPDGTDAIKVTLNSTAGWNGLANITLKTPMTLGTYVKIKYDVYSDLDLYKSYLKVFGNGQASPAITEGWSSETPVNTWKTAELGLLDPQRDGSKTRKTGNIESLLLIPGLGWDANAVALDGKVAYFKNFRLEKGEDTPAPHQAEPVAYWKSYVSAFAVNVDGLDKDKSWDEPADKYVVKSDAVAGFMTAATFYSCWDSQKLYFFLNVTDNNSVVGFGDTGFNASWQGDGIQFYFDIFDRHFDATQADMINGAAICPGMQKAAAGDTISQLVAETKGTFGDYSKGIQLAATVSGSKYTMELAIPWQAFYKAAKLSDVEIAQLVASEIKVGKKMAVGIQLNDYDPVTKARIAAVSVPNPPEEGGIYGKPKYWAQLELIGNGTPYYDPDYKNGGATTGTPRISRNDIQVFSILGYINVVGENLKSVEVYSISGTKLYNSIITDNTITIPSASFAKGVYLVKITDNNGFAVTKKVIR